MKQFLIKKHIKQKRLQNYVNNCTKQTIDTGDLQFPHEKSDFSIDVSQMYYIQKHLEKNKTTPLKQV